MSKFPNDDTKFKDGQSGNPNGRPPKLETALKNHFLGEHNVRLSNSQVNELLTVFLSKTKSEVLEMAKDDNLPFWVELIVRKAAKDAKTGSIELLEKLLDRVFGKPKNTNELTGKDGSELGVKLDLSNATIEQLESIIKSGKGGDTD